ncbi:hypothetical protein [Parapedobacter tibetensis]|uniref:hypothetical protein n=1 Tax=Parapedobacter tibetensis TaxID=2972951 RepID=UPI00214DA17E|nr:hypothetical protein [Parapedobacter tibetensis]
MKKLLTYYARKPYLLDLIIALILLPLFCHLVVALYSRRTIGELIVMRGYQIPMVISYLCGLLVMAYLRTSNYMLNKRYGIDDGWEYRLIHQLRWNILPPLAFVLLVITAYFALFGQNILDRGYFRREVFLVLLGIVLLVLLYYVQNKHRYLWNKQREQEEYDQLAAGNPPPMAAMDDIAMGEPVEAKPSIWVVQPERRRVAILMPIDAAAIIDRHNGKTTVSTWDGQLYEWPMPSTQMKALVETHGFTWLGQHYALLHNSVDNLEGIGDKGCKLRLKLGIVVGKEKQVWMNHEDGQERTYLLFHRNISSGVRSWYEETCEKGRPVSERP